MKGSYILLIKLSSRQTITVGSLKVISFPSGYYAYVTSALGAFAALVTDCTIEVEKVEDK